jgi:branched-chain amino acid transport system permease protein
MVPLPVIISGFAMGCIYALVALGYVFIWNSMAIINFGQGEFLMFAAFVYVATFSLHLKLGFGPSVLLTAAPMGLLGAAFSRTVYSLVSGVSPNWSLSSPRWRWGSCSKRGAPHI